MPQRTNMEKAREMDKFKEFQGRDLDECISQALQWFDAPREALEIEILQDAKSGIFGIVGARKAKIRAKRVHVAETVRSLLETDTEKPANANETHAGETRSEPGLPDDLQQEKSGKQRKKQAKIEQASQTPGERSDQSRPGPDAECPEEEAPGSKDLDKRALAQNALAIVKNLLTPLAGKEITAHVNLDSGKPRVRVDWEGDAGLLIGREGQTLAAIQYLASRILSRAMGAPINLQLDVGEYRTRQDDKLRELALSLAEKVRRTGRPLSTRPLSSYHRRVVHMCLQGELDLQTRSAGDGALKRVLISPRRS